MMFVDIAFLGQSSEWLFLGGVHTLRLLSTLHSRAHVQNPQDGFRGFVEPEKFRSNGALQKNWQNSYRYPFEGTVNFSMSVRLRPRKYYIAFPSQKLCHLSTVAVKKR
jgi:hypothetical protein